MLYNVYYRIYIIAKHINRYEWRWWHCILVGAIKIPLITKILDVWGKRLCLRKCIKCFDYMNFGHLEKSWWFLIGKGWSWRRSKSFMGNSVAPLCVKILLYFRDPSKKTQRFCIPKMRNWTRHVTLMTFDLTVRQFSVACWLDFLASEAVRTMTYNVQREINIKTIQSHPTVHCKTGTNQEWRECRSNQKTAEIRRNPIDQGGNIYLYEDLRNLIGKIRNCS